jgi:hypothetical protein
MVGPGSGGLAPDCVAKPDQYFKSPRQRDIEPQNERLSDVFSVYTALIVKLAHYQRPAC